MKRFFKPSKAVVGWREWVEIPGSKISKIRAKVDTGAATSSLHADEIRRFRRGNKRYIEFYAYPSGKSERGRTKIRAPYVEDRHVTSSTGESQKRPVVSLEIMIGDRRITTEVTLAKRDKMGFRMLIGRKTLKNNFVVDVSKSFHAKDRFKH